METSADRELVAERTRRCGYRRRRGLLRRGRRIVPGRPVAQIGLSDGARTVVPAGLSRDCQTQHNAGNKLRLPLRRGFFVRRAEPRAVRARFLRNHSGIRLHGLFQRGSMLLPGFRHVFLPRLYAIVSAGLSVVAAASPPLMGTLAPLLGGAFSCGRPPRGVQPMRRLPRSVGLPPHSSTPESRQAPFSDPQT